MLFIINNMQVVKEEYRDDALTAKEILSSEGGFYPESMAPLLGGYGLGHHGKLMKLGHPVIVADFICKSEKGRLLGQQTSVFLPVLLDIDEDGNDVWVYTLEGMSPDDAYKLFEVWAKMFVAEVHADLTEEVQ